MVQLVDPAEVAARNARLSDSPEAPAARFDWIWSYDVERAMADRARVGQRASGDGQRLSYRDWFTAVPIR